ncbi:MAG: hypothetical protein M1836_007519 [Candelina mexicana]|nr:MAG: hypothetical protein M1836_007519 [Candelina mexicana]
MPAGRVILDSDEEGEDDAAPPHLAPPPEGSPLTTSHIVSLSGAETQKSAEASTGSTDLLNRDIQDAHRALMEPTPESKGSNPSTNVSAKRPAMSPVMSRNKRRKTMAGASVETMKQPTSVERRKSLKTYGSKDRGERGSSVSEVTGSSSRLSGADQRHAAEKADEDEWDVPGSSPSRDPLASRREAGSTKVRSRTAVQDTITVGSNQSKGARRSKTLGGLIDRPGPTFSDVTDFTPPTPSKGKGKWGIASSSGDEDEIIGQPRRKRVKRSITMHGHPEAHQQAVTAVDQKNALSEPTSAHNENKTGHSIAVDLSDPALALTTSQKDQYTVPSKNPSQPGVKPTTADMFGFGDPFARFPGESSTIPNTTPVEAPSRDVEVSASTKTSTGSSELLQHLLPSSPPVDPTSLAASASASQRSKGLRRSKSSQPVQQPSPNALLESMTSTNGLTSPTVKARRNRRTATIAAIKTQDPHGDAPNLGTPLADTTIGGAVRQEISEINEADDSNKVVLQEPISSKDVASKKDLQADELGSDDIAIGLPKEQYKPRPSRSRSVRNADSLVETVDFSKRPEAQARARIKRSKTLGATPQANSSTDLSNISSNKLEEGGTIEIDTKAKQKRFGHPEKVPEAQKHPAETVTEDETIHDEIGSEAPTPDRATAELVIEHEHHTLPDQAYSGEVLQGEQQGSVQQPEPADERTTNHSRLTNSLPETQKEAEIISIPKLRGRPRKATQAPKPRKRRKTEDAPIQSSEEPTNEEITNPAVTHDPTNPVVALAEIDGNKPPTKPLSLVPTATPENKQIENGSGPTPSPAQPPSEILTPKRPTTTSSSSGKGPDKHSPLNSGKVPYRVGLSKRARIEPLLRIVKK